MTSVASKEVSQAAAGISISLDKIVSALQDENNVPAVDVVVCSVGNRSMVKEKAAVIRELWAAGIKSSLIDSLQVCCDLRSVNLFTADIVLLQMLLVMVSSVFLDCAGLGTDMDSVIIYYCS